MIQGNRVERRRRCAVTATYVLILTLAGALVESDPVMANGSEVLDSAMGLIPVESDSVQLSSESVSVDLSSWSFGCRVNCRYILRNLRMKPARVQMAFVAGIPADYRTYLSAHSDFPFKVRTESPDRSVTKTDPQTPAWREEEITYRMRPVAPNAWSLFAPGTVDSLPTWNVNLGEHDSTFVVVEYTSGWSGLETGPDSTGYEFTYHARPAALWTGPIEDTRVEFNFGDILTDLIRCMDPSDRCSHVELSPKNYEWTEFGVSWRFRDWEPDSDFTVRITSLRHDSK